MVPKYAFPFMNQTGNARQIKAVVEILLNIQSDFDMAL